MVPCPSYIDYGDGTVSLGFGGVVIGGHSEGNVVGSVKPSRSMPGTYRLGDGIDSFSLRIDLDVGEATASGIFVAFNPDNPFLDVRGEVEVTLSAIQPSDSIFHEVGGTVTGTALKISDDTPVSFAVNF